MVPGIKMINTESLHCILPAMNMYFWNVCDHKMDKMRKLQTLKGVVRQQKDIVTVSAMMGAFIDNDCSNEALDLYDKIEGFNAKIQRDNIYAIIWCLKRVERFGKGRMY